MRMSGDEIVHGVVKSGFDYDLQVWVEDFIIQPCGHTWKAASTVCKDECTCPAGRAYAGRDIRSVEGRQSR